MPICKDVLLRGAPFDFQGEWKLVSGDVVAIVVVFAVSPLDFRVGRFIFVAFGGKGVFF